MRSVGRTAVARVIGTESVGTDTLGTGGKDIETLGNEREEADTLGRTEMVKDGRVKDGADMLKDGRDKEGDRVILRMEIEGNVALGMDKEGKVMLGIEIEGIVADGSEIEGRVGFAIDKEGRGMLEIEIEGICKDESETEESVAYGSEIEGNVIDATVVRETEGSSTEEIEIDGNVAGGREGEGNSTEGTEIDDNAAGGNPVGTLTSTTVVEASRLTIVPKMLVNGSDPDVWTIVRKLAGELTGALVTDGKSGTPDEGETAGAEIEGITGAGDADAITPVVLALPERPDEGGVGEEPTSDGLAPLVGEEIAEKGPVVNVGVPITTVGRFVSVGIIVKIEVVLPSIPAVQVAIGAVMGAVRLVGVKT